jgi:pSer/pThr/pTyr-binding forkhead associated (FHA) protein
MHDGRTRRVEPLEPERVSEFLERHQVSLTVIKGPSAGTEWKLEGSRTIVGRSDLAGIRLDDPSVSSEHAAFELDARGFGIRDLASTNHVVVNGKEVLSAALEHGDRIRLGECELQYVIEDRAPRVKTWSVDQDA